MKGKDTGQGYQRL